MTKRLYVVNEKEEDYVRRAREGKKLMGTLEGQVIEKVILGMTGVTVITKNGVRIGGGGESASVDFPDGTFVTKIFDNYVLQGEKDE